MDSKSKTIKIQHLVIGKTKAKNLRTKLEIHKRIDTNELFILLESKRLVSFEKRQISYFKKIFTFQTFMTLIGLFKHVEINEKLQKEIDEFVKIYPPLETKGNVEYFLGK